MAFIVLQTLVDPFLLEVYVHLEVLQFELESYPFFRMYTFTIVRALNADNPSTYIATVTNVGRPAT